MSDLRKVQIASILFAARFWIVTFVYYLNKQGVPTDQVFLAIGFLYFVSMLLEYPTGVIGDYYSHRTSVLLGYTILAVSMLLLSLPGGLPYYLMVLFFHAIGTTLVSGSDTALLHSVSDDFSKQYANLSTLWVVVSVISIVIGGSVGTLDLRYPFYFTSLALGIAAVLIFTLKDYTYESDSSNFLEKAREGWRYTFSHQTLLPILGISGLVGGIFYNYKWLYSPIFEAMQLPLPWWGIVSGVAILSIALGSRLTTRFPEVSWLLVVILISLGIFLSGMTEWGVIVCLGLLVSHTARGYLETSTMVQINRVITGKIRSSVLSLNSVTIRLIAAVYTGIGGLVLGKVSIAFFLFGTALVVGILGLFLIGKMRTVKESTI